jgi:hypothetical protein
MKISTLKERIEKATQKIEKKENTITKKTAQIEKKYKALEKLGVKDPTEHDREEFRNAENWHDIFWTYADIENLKADIIRGGKEIEETKATLAKYEAQLAGEIEKESIFLKEIPEVMIRLQNELVETWDAWDKARKERIRKAYDELGYSKFIKEYTYRDYEFMNMDLEKIHSDNERDARALILDLYYRVKDVTGEVTDWSGIKATIGTGGFTVLNGVVIGKAGRAKVESILAGGYNIQRLHVRVLVHEI